MSRTIDFHDRMKENAIYYYADQQSRAGMSGGPALNNAGKVVGTVAGAGGTALENDLDSRGKIQASADTFLSPTSWLWEVLSSRGEIDFQKFTAKIDEFRRGVNPGMNLKRCERLFTER